VHEKCSQSFSYRSRVSIRFIVTIWRELQSQVRIPAQARDFSLLQNVQSWSGVHLASLSMGKVGPFIGAKADRARGWPPISISAKFKNEWNYTSSTLYAFTACTETTVSLLFYEKKLFTIPFCLKTVLNTIDRLTCCGNHVHHSSSKSRNSTFYLLRICYLRAW
jgi:hypothetical protein